MPSTIPVAYDLNKNGPQAQAQVPLSNNLIGVAHIGLVAFHTAQAINNSWQAYNNFQQGYYNNKNNNQLPTAGVAVPIAASNNSKSLIKL